MPAKFDPFNDKIAISLSEFSLLKKPGWIGKYFEPYIISFAVDSHGHSDPEVSFSALPFPKFRVGQTKKFLGEGHLIYGPSQPGEFVAFSMLFMESEKDVRLVGEEVKRTLEREETKSLVRALLLARPDVGAAVAAIGQVTSLVADFLSRKRDKELFRAEGLLLRDAGQHPYDINTLTSDENDFISCETRVIPLIQSPISVDVPGLIESSLGGRGIEPRPVEKISMLPEGAKLISSSPLGGEAILGISEAAVEQDASLGEAGEDIAPVPEVVLSGEQLERDQRQVEARERSFPDPNEWLGREFDLLGVVATSDVKWPSNDANCPDYRHLVGATPSSEFDITPEDIELLIRKNRFQPKGRNNVITLAIRGCVLTSGHEAIRKNKVRVREARPDHRNFRCLLGFYYRDEKKITLFSGSTVPNPKAVNAQMGNSAPTSNMLPSGCYVYRVATHSGGKIKPALRCTDPGDLASDAVVTVLRTRNDGYLGTKDWWHRTVPLDNVHCAYATGYVSAYKASFSSWGCLTVRGSSAPSDQWEEFQEILDNNVGGQGSRTDVILLTGKDYGIAASSRKGEMDAASVDEYLTCLRVGSHGDEVARLQRKMGFSGNSKYFGPSTRERLAHWQQAGDVGKTFGPGEGDGNYYPAVDRSTDWNVFESRSAAPDSVEAGEDGATTLTHVDSKEVCPTCLQELPSEGAAISLPQGDTSTAVLAGENEEESSSGEVTILSDTNSPLTFAATEPPIFQPRVVMIHHALGLSPADGKFGPNTKRAVEKFQQNQGLPVTGIVDQQTGERLRLPYWTDGRERTLATPFRDPSKFSMNHVFTFKSLVEGGYFSDKPERFLKNDKTTHRSVRTNNIGAVNISEWQKSWPGYVGRTDPDGPGNKTTIYTAPEYGIAVWYYLITVRYEQVYKLISGGSGSTINLRRLAKTYGLGKPNKPDHDLTPKEKEFVEYYLIGWNRYAKKAGFGNLPADAEIDPRKERQMLKLAYAMFSHEAGYLSPIMARQILDGFRRAKERIIVLDQPELLETQSIDAHSLKEPLLRSILESAEATEEDKLEEAAASSLRFKSFQHFSNNNP